MNPGTGVELLIPDFNAIHPTRNILLYAELKDMESELRDKKPDKPGCFTQVEWLRALAAWNPFDVHDPCFVVMAPARPCCRDRISELLLGLPPA